MSSTASTEPTLLRRVRAGDLAAFDELYRRDVADALRYARRIARQGANAEDIVADAFTRTLRAMSKGRGPTDGFRRYLFTAVRRTAVRSSTHAVAVPVGLDPTMTVPARTHTAAPPVSGDSGVPEEVVAKAFEKLPGRWQQVLWLVEVEGRPVADVARVLDLTPAATSALAYRARRGLREAYQELLENSSESRPSTMRERRHDGELVGL